MSEFVVMDMSAFKRKGRSKRVSVQAMSVEDYHAHISNRERKASIKRYDKTKVLLDSIQREHLPSINHMLLYDRIYGFFERNKYVTKVYHIMLKKLIDGYPFDEIVVREYLWDTYGK